jgi:DeoR/GlpR family transcriptional regulator of sugar metabolism
VTQEANLLPSRRRELILRSVRAAGSASVSTLAGQVGVSEMTVRRDLDHLHRVGKLRRVHGGATVESGEPPFAEVAVARYAEKDRIGAAASQLVRDGETVLLDIGTTTLQLARHLHGRSLRVVTSNLAVYEELLPEQDVELVLLGGTVRRNYRSLVGFLAEESLRQLRVDRLFMGACGMQADLSVMDDTMAEVPVKRGMLAAAREVVLLMDADKFTANVGVARVCGPEAIDVLITDDRAPEHRVQELEQAGVQVVIA